MAATPRPILDPSRPRRFRHQCLGFPVTTEWLEARAVEEWGVVGSTPQVAIRMLGAHPNFEYRMLRSVTAPGDRKNEMLCVPLAENTSKVDIRDPPEDEVEAIRKHTGATGLPLWYDVVC